MGIPNTFNTPDRIIRMAMKNAGLLEDGDDPLGENYADYLARLNDLVNLWQTQGIKLFLNQILSITLQAGMATYTLGPGGAISADKKMRVLEGYFEDSAGESRPLTPYSWNTYQDLPNKTLAGSVFGYFVDKQVSNLVISLWQVPDATAATGTVKLIVQNPVAQMANLTDPIGFPVEWYMALHWGLADDICTGQPEAIVQRCAARAKAFREALENWDVEDASVTFSLDSQYTRGSRFRT